MVKQIYVVTIYDQEKTGSFDFEPDKTKSYHYMYIPLSGVNMNILSFL